jgi:hypothetical protein
MKLPTIKDSRDRESSTLMFVGVSWTLVTLRFAFGGFFNMPATSVTEYAGGVAMILAIWLGREWTEKSNAP